MRRLGPYIIGAVRQAAPQHEEEEWR